MPGSHNLVYNPREKDKQQLIEEFVVRTELFEKIFRDIKTSKMEFPETQYLVIGQRGMGKTTLLHRLRYAIEDDPELNPWLIPVTFPEEHYGIHDLAGLWEAVAEYLSGQFKDFAGLDEEMQQVTLKNPEAKYFDMLQARLNAKGKKLILFIDNFNQLLDKIGHKQAHRIRAILQKNPEIRVVAADPEETEELYGYDKPLYGFFKLEYLTGLGRTECHTLLRAIAKVHGDADKMEKIIRTEGSRIETLRELSGGAIRTIAILYEILEKDNKGDVFNDLEELLDRVTAYYKHRMDDLKPKQQAIVDAIARAWEGVFVKDLAKDHKLKRIGLTPKIISAQINVLIKNGWIEKIDTGTKNNIYRLSERFYNIWYLMRVTPKHDKQRVIWLVRFFEAWYKREEMELLIKELTQEIGSGNYNSNAAFHKTMALLMIGSEDIVSLETLRYRVSKFLESSDKTLSKTILNESSAGSLPFHVTAKIYENIWGPVKEMDTFIQTLQREVEKSTRKSSKNLNPILKRIQDISIYCTLLKIAVRTNKQPISLIPDIDYLIEFFIQYSIHREMKHAKQAAIQFLCASPENHRLVQYLPFENFTLKERSEIIASVYNDGSDDTKVFTDFLIAPLWLNIYEKIKEALSHNSNIDISALLSIFSILIGKEKREILPILFPDSESILDFKKKYLPLYAYLFENKSPENLKFGHEFKPIITKLKSLENSWREIFKENEILDNM